MRFTNAHMFQNLAFFQGNKNQNLTFSLFFFQKKLILSRDFLIQNVMRFEVFTSVSDKTKEFFFQFYRIVNFLFDILLFISLRL